MSKLPPVGPGPLLPDIGDEDPTVEVLANLEAELDAAEERMGRLRRAKIRTSAALALVLLLVALLGFVLILKYHWGHETHGTVPTGDIMQWLRYRSAG